MPSLRSGQTSVAGPGLRATRPERRRGVGRWSVRPALDRPSVIPRMRGALRGRLDCPACLTPGVLGLLALGFVWGGWACAAEEPLSAGFLYDRFPLTLDSGRRTEAVGPLYATEERWPEDAVPPGTDPLEATPPVTKIARTFTLAPLFNWNSEPLVENVSWDLAYPVITYDRYGGEYKLQVFQMLSFSGGRTQAHAEGKAFTLVPFFWYRHSAQDPSLNYAAFWPFYGYLQKRLFRDETRFILWPVYAQTRKRDVITDNYLVPFVHVRRGDGLKGWQVTLQRRLGRRRQRQLRIWNQTTTVREVVSSHGRHRSLPHGLNRGERRLMRGRTKKLRRTRRLFPDRLRSRVVVVWRSGHTFRA